MSDVLVFLHTYAIMCAKMHMHNRIVHVQNIKYF